MASQVYPRIIDQSTKCWALVHLGTHRLRRRAGEGPTECGRKPPAQLVTDTPPDVTCPDCIAQYWYNRARDEAAR